MLRTIIIIMVVLLTLMTVFGFMSGRVSSISLAVAVAWNVFLLPFALFVNRMSDLACRIGLHIALVGGLARWTFGWLLSPTSDIFPATITGLLLPPILLFAISFFETPRRSAWTGYLCAGVMGATLIIGSLGKTEGRICWRGGCKQSKKRIPGQHQPRDQNTDERHHRLV